MTPQKTQAIQAALNGDWQTTISLNQEILQENPDDLDTMNRLAFAYASMGNTKEAKTLYQKVLEIDTENPIALKNLKRLATVGSSNGFSVPRNNVFIEESGKTRVIDLINVADQKVLLPLQSGESLTLSIKRMKVFMLDHNKQYIGMLPDDIGKRLIKFIEGGNEYEAFVKTMSTHKVTIFIRESKRAAKFKNQPSFIFTDKAKLHIDSKGSSKHAAKSHDDDDDKSYSSDDGDDGAETELL